MKVNEDEGCESCCWLIELENTKSLYCTTRRSKISKITTHQQEKHTEF